MINEFLRYAYNSQGCKVSEMTQRKRPSLIKTGFLAVTSKPLLLIPDLTTEVLGVVATTTTVRSGISHCLTVRINTRTQVVVIGGGLF